MAETEATLQASDEPIAAADASGTVLIAAEHMYWALLEPGSSRLGARARLYQAEARFPQPLESLQCAHAVAADGRVVVVGIPPAQLQQDLAEAGGAVWSAQPAAPPTHLREQVSAATCARLELLLGAFEPAARRRLRRSSLALAAAAALVVLLTLAWGVYRRVAHDQALAARWARHASEQYAAAVPLEDRGGLHPAIAVEQELRRLQSVSGGAVAGLTPCAGILDQFWRGWPRRMRVQVDTVTVDGDRLLVRGAVADMATAESLDAALRGCPLVQQAGWQMAALELHQQQDQVRFHGRFIRPSGEEP